MKKIIYSIMFITALSNNAKADKLSDIEEIAALTIHSSEFTQMSQDTFKNGVDMIKCTFENISPQDEQKINALFSDLQNMSAINQYIYNFYNDNFTKEQIKTILDFYKSDAGKKMMALQPKIMTDTMLMISSKTEELQPKIINLIENIATNSKAKSVEEMQKCLKKMAH